MKVLVSGSTGFVGSAVCPLLGDRGHQVIRLVRQSSHVPGGATTVSWDPEAGTVDREALAAARPDGVLHLAGENVAEGRWTAAKKARIRDSRVQGTRVLANALAALETPPRVFVSPSGINYYGDRGDEELTESSPPGTGFLADVCREWEDASRPLEEAGVRVVRLRTGMVLSPRGGALKKMLPVFKMGMGGRLGDGRQYVSWIALDDQAAILVMALEDDALSGVVNAVSPHPVTNAEFTRALGKALGKPTVCPVPAFAAKLAFGQMATELLLSSLRVLPAVLETKGYTFAHPEIEGALRHMLSG